MIIEFFGPPGAGKTTFARALAARLADHGLRAELSLSYRPGENVLGLNVGHSRMEQRQSAFCERLRRALIESLRIARHPIANAKDVETALQLERALRPANLWSRLKRGQYLSRLSHSWREKSQLGEILLFDQAFVQSVCSLAMEAGVVDDGSIAEALKHAPKSDLIIRLQAPTDLLESRLKSRMSQLNGIEQSLEPDLEKSVASLPIFDRVHNVLLRQGRCVFCASSVSLESLEESLSRVEQNIVVKLEGERAGAEI